MIPEIHCTIKQVGPIHQIGNRLHEDRRDRIGMRRQSRGKDRSMVKKIERNASVSESGYTECDDRYV